MNPETNEIEVFLDHLSENSNRTAIRMTREIEIDNTKSFYFRSPETVQHSK